SPAASAEDTRARDNPARRLSSIGSLAVATSKTASVSIARTRSARSSARRGPLGFVSTGLGSKLLGCSWPFMNPRSMLSTGDCPRHCVATSILSDVTPGGRAPAISVYFLRRDASAADGCKEPEQGVAELDRKRVIK